MGPSTKLELSRAFLRGPRDTRRRPEICAAKKRNPRKFDFRFRKNREKAAFPLWGSRDGKKKRPPPTLQAEGPNPTPPPPIRNCVLLGRKKTSRPRVFTPIGARGNPKMVPRGDVRK